MMISFKNRTRLLFFLLGAVCLASCQKDEWDKHISPVEQNLEKSLLDVIKATPDLSKFNEYLVRTKYDQLLDSSKTITVWAPNNDALSKLPQEIVNDQLKLKQFIAYHIAYQSHFTTKADPNTKIRTLSGKNVAFGPDEFEDAKVTKADTYVKNGVLHIIDAASLPKLNAWEYLQSYPGASKLLSFIDSLNHIEMDTSNAVKLYTDRLTGKSVFQEGTYFPVVRNYYFQRVADIRNEDSLYTFVILRDQAFIEEKSKLLSYYHVDSAFLRDSITRWNVARDLVFKNVYSKDQLATSITSVNGVKVRINASDIVETRQLSNGIAYVVDRINYDLLENKIPTIIIQGENIVAQSFEDASSIRTKRDASGNTFRDIQFSGIKSTTDPLHYFRYTPVLNAIKYKVYWRAINDVFTTPFRMKVDFGSFPYPKSSEPSDMKSTGYKEVKPVDTDPQAYDEAYLGEVIIDNYGLTHVYLMASSGATSSAPTALSLDYLKLVPVN